MKCSPADASHGSVAGIVNYQSDTDGDMEDQLIPAESIQGYCDNTQHVCFMFLDIQVEQC